MVEYGKNLRNADVCDFCIHKISCHSSSETKVCDSFEKTDIFIKKIPGFPVMSQRDWDILSG